MIKSGWKSLFSLTTIGLFIGACQMASTATPARLTDNAPETMAALKAGLAEAMGKAKIDLGAGDLTQQSRISVLPPRLGPHEGASAAMPVQFDLMMDAETCFVIREDTGERFDLPGVTCRKLNED